MRLSKEKIAALLLAAITILTLFQGLIPALPGVGQHTTTLISAISLYMVSALGIWRQYVSPEIGNASIRPTVIMAILATVGGLNDLLNVVHFSELTEQWVRFGITFITLIINVMSKVVWPTPETKTII